jgi:hypothetical protein
MIPVPLVIYTTMIPRYIGALIYPTFLEKEEHLQTCFLPKASSKSQVQSPFSFLTVFDFFFFPVCFFRREGRPERAPQTHRRSSLPQSSAYRTLLSAPGSLTPQSHPTSSSLEAWTYSRVLARSISILDGRSPDCPPRRFCMTMRIQYMARCSLAVAHGVQVQWHDPRNAHVLLCCSVCTVHTKGKLYTGYPLSRYSPSHSHSSTNGAPKPPHFHLISAMVK